jgi:hypothetical protein
MEEAHKRRLGAVPGMTGYWQTSGRSDLSFEEMVRLGPLLHRELVALFRPQDHPEDPGRVLRREGAY